MDFNVQEAQPHHLAYIVSFQKAMALETEQIHLDEITLTKGVDAVLKAIEKGIYYLITDNFENPVACCLTTYEWSDWRNGTVLWIQSLYVVPEFRRKGIFKFLYSYLQEKVKQSPDLKGIRLYVDKRNKMAYNAYKAAGMNNEHYEMFEWIPSF